MSIVNLLEETLKDLNKHNKSPEDVLWVGNEYDKTTWEGFESVANIEYDSEYDGGEWWDFKTLPKCESNEFKKLVNVRENWNSGLEFE